MDFHLFISILFFLFLSISIRYKLIKKDKVLGEIFIIGVLCRFIFAYFQDVDQLIPYSWDEKAFILAGESLLHYWDFSNFIFPFNEINSITSYGTFLAVVAKVFGNYTLIFRIVNGLLGSLVIIIIFFISKKYILNKKLCYLIALIIAVSPTFVIFSTLIMRDSIVWVLTLIVLYFNLTAIKTKNLNYFLLGIIFSILLVLFRTLNAPILVLLSFLTLILIIVQNTFFIKNIELKFIKSAIIFFLGVTGILLSLLILFLIIFTYGKADLIDYASAELMWRNQGGGAYLEYIKYNNLYDILYYFPIKFIYFFFGPFLWEANTSFMVFSSIESLINPILFIIFIINFKVIKKFDFIDKLVFFYIFIFTFTFIGSNSIIDANFGTAIRHRMIFMPTFYLLTFILIDKHQAFKNLK